MMGERDIFLSHASPDKEFVRRLAADVGGDKGGRRLTVWLDEAEIRPGESITSAVNGGLEMSRFIALVMTPNYFSSRSGWTDAEWHAALFVDPDNRKARLLPIIAADCPHIPVLLGHLLRFDLRGGNYERELQRLCATLRGDPMPRPGAHRGRTLDGGGTIARSSVIAELVPADSQSDHVEERLSSNLLPFIELPQHVYTASVRPDRNRAKALSDWETKRHLIDRIKAARGTKSRYPLRLPPFRMVGENIFTFTDLGSPKSPFRRLLQRASIKRRTVASFDHSDDDRMILTSLLNLAVNQLCRSRHLLSSYEPGRGHRYYFRPNGDGTERTFEWTPSRRSARRTVAKPLSKADPKAGWIHAGAYLDVVHLGGHQFLKVRPTWLLTEDGYKPRSGPDVARVVNRWTNAERNIHVLYHVRFWSTVLSMGQDHIAMKAGAGKIVVGSLPAQIALPFGIIGDAGNPEALLDAEATLTEREEMALIERAMQFAAEEAEDDDEGQDEGEPDGDFELTE